MGTKCRRVALTPTQRELFALLKEHQDEGRPVRADEIRAVTGWKASTVRTYLSKQLRSFLEEVTPGEYRVVGLGNLGEEEFRRLLTQSESVRGRFEPRDSWSRDLRALNPWWSGDAGVPVPQTRRWLFGRLYRSFRQGIAPVTVLRGPRRVGKTTLLRQAIGQLQKDGVDPRSIVYIPFDDIPSLLEPEVILRIVRSFEAEILGRTFNAGEEPGYLVLDEVQNLEHWAGQVKHLVDNHKLRVLLTGSSSLRIQAEIDQLAGRLTTLDLGPLLPREVHALSSGTVQPPFWEDNGQRRILDRTFWREARAHCEGHDEEVRGSFELFSSRGGYPVAYEHPDTDWEELADWLRENVVQRALLTDMVRLGWRDQQEARILFEVLRLCCRYAGQAPSLPTLLRELRPVLGDSVATKEVRDALDFLEASRLLTRVRPLEARARKNRAAPKLCLCDHSLRAAWLQEPLSLAQDQGPLLGYLAESTLGYHLSAVPGLEVSTYPQRSAEEPEVDFVLTVGAVRLPLEVKYQANVSDRDLAGLRAFLKRFPESPFGILVTREPFPCDDERIVAIPLRCLLWLR